MGKPLKIILSLFAVVVLLLIAAACILPFVINPNDFKPEIAALIKDKTGRELVLDGDLTLSLFPGAHITTGKMTLSNAPDFQDQPFATLEEGEINVALWPLLSKKIEISRIVLKGLAVNLTRNPQGISNWADLTDSAPTTTASNPTNQPATPDAAKAAVAIGSITLEQAHINWHDQQTGQVIEITGIDLNSARFAFDEPVAVALALTVLDKKSQLTHDLKLNTALSVNAQLDTFALRQTDMQLNTAGKTVPGKAMTAALTIADMALAMSQQTAKISGLQLKSTGMTLSADLTGTAITDQPSFQGAVSLAEFNPVNSLQQLGLARPKMQDEHALNKLAIHFDWAATADSAQLQNLVLTVDDTQIKGLVTVQDFTQPAIRFDLVLDTLDLDRYLSPVNKTSKPLASPALMLATGFSALPIETLRKINADGVMALGKLTVNDLIMQDVQIKLNSKKGVVSSQQHIKRFYQGSYSGNLTVDKRGDQPVVAINEKIERVQLEPLLKDYRGIARMSGSLNAAVQWQGQGRKADELKTSAKGQLSFLLKDSVIKDFNVQKIIDEGKALIKGSSLPAEHKQDQTLFSTLSGTATLANGVLQNNDLVGKSAKLQVDGQGNINLISEALAYKFDAKLLKTDATEAEAVKGNVIINVAGTVSKPTYRVDIASLLTEKNKAKVDKVIDKVDKKLGSGVGKLLKKFLKKKEQAQGEGEKAPSN